MKLLGCAGRLSGPSKKFAGPVHRSMQLCPHPDRVYDSLTHCVGSELDHSEILHRLWNISIKGNQMRRDPTRIGDIFSVNMGDGTEKYFQLVAYDSSQLNSDVIRAFSIRYQNEDSPELEEVVQDEVDFHAHCVAKLGLKLGHWNKVGNVSPVLPISVWFRDTNDAGFPAGGQPVKISSKWYVWRVNEEFQRVGRLTGAHRDAEIGVVVTPGDIVTRMKTGKYEFVYPGFE